jgi:hypothetical protein
VCWEEERFRIKIEQRTHYMTRCVTETHDAGHVRSLYPVHHATDRFSYYERLC